MTATVDARDLCRLIHNTRPFAVADDVRPSLTAIRLIVRAERVWALAADPYMCAVDSCKPSGPVVGTADLSVPLAIAEEIEREAASLIHLAKRRNPKAPTYPAYTVRSTADGSVFQISGATQTREFREPGTFPDVYKVIHPFVEQALAPLERVALNPQFLKRFTNIRLNDEPSLGMAMTFHFRNGGKTHEPIEIAIGATFRALLMPVRIPEERVEQPKQAAPVAE